jgi:hypothetical protein
MTAPRILLASLLASLIALTLGLVGIPATHAAAPTYVAVIDAGSSGTRLALFEQGSGVTVTQVYSAPKKTPGLSSFATDTAAAGPDAVQPLLDQLRTHLDSQGIAIAEVPVALLATAGMRRLKLNDPVAVRDIFASTRATIDASGFPLRANRILPDTQEALLAWLDANARTGTLGTPSQDIGVVEVGGASAQVAFRSPRASGPGVAAVRVNGKDIHVVAISYLGLGANEARGFMQAAADGGEVCFPNNASGTDPVDYLSTSSLPVPSAQADFRGSPCGRAYATVVQDVAGAYPRAVRPRNLSDLPGFARATFVGLGSIPFVYSDFAIAPDADERRALQSAIRMNCKGADAWQTVSALFPAGSQSFAETQCSSGAYLDRFLFSDVGVGLDPARFDAQSDLPGGDPSWSEGYAITALHP